MNQGGRQETLQIARKSEDNLIEEELRPLSAGNIYEGFNEKRREIEAGYALYGAAYIVPGSTAAASFAMAARDTRSGSLG